MKYTYSKQKGKPGHCFAAQIWDEEGKSIAIIKSTNEEKEADQIACLFSKAPEMLEALKGIYAIKDLLFYPAKIKTEHIGDAIAGSEAVKKIEVLLKKLES